MSNPTYGLNKDRKDESVRPGTALTGATKAFGKPVVAPKPDLAKLNPKSNNGALSAAAKSWAISSAAQEKKKNTSETITPISKAVFPAPSLPPKPHTSQIVELRSSSMSQSPLDASSRLRDEQARLKTRESSLAREPPKPPAPRRTGVIDQKSSTGPETAFDAAIRATSQSRVAPQIFGLESTRIPSMSPHRVPHFRDQSMKMLSPHVTGESLSNAIVGAHLAISRSPPRHKSPLPSPPRHSSILKQQKPVGSRGPSPRKAPGPMRETLRSSESSTSSEDGGHRFRPKRHPHKHHEGERKKWRDRLTDEEIKRYAGWWAANRGLHVPATCAQSQDPLLNQAVIDASYKPEEEILNVVVRELWERSRLPHNVLMEIWDLVDDRRIGSLAKEQFIVGVWLIDQKLKGHKLPTHVSQSIWQSVSRINGVDVKIRVT